MMPLGAPCEVGLWDDWNVHRDPHGSTVGVHLSDLNFWAGHGPDVNLIFVTTM